MQKHVKIAAIFDHDTNMRHDLMFVNAVKSVNRLPGLLQGVTLVSLVLTSFTPVSSFHPYIISSIPPPLTNWCRCRLYRRSHQTTPSLQRRQHARSVLFKHKQFFVDF